MHFQGYLPVSLTITTILQTNAEMYSDRVSHQELIADSAAGEGGARCEVNRIIADKARAQHLLQTEIFGATEQFDFLRHPFDGEVLGIEEYRHHAELSLTIGQQSSSSSHAL